MHATKNHIVNGGKKIALLFLFASGEVQPWASITATQENHNGKRPSNAKKEEEEDEELEVDGDEELLVNSGGHTNFDIQRHFERYGSLNL